ncbi:MAG: GntR family transcriptional regulator [Tropicimonas sp.]|uniref:GntR family transcriptional regulator n=1 Tax=Tropicimonas sp. TaxID=2067044 RepID=UPI003A8B32F6
MKTPEYNRSLPLHVQVRDLIRAKAISGDLVDETGRLKTEAELVEIFGVSRVTIRNALSPLVQDGLFDRTPGRGTYLRSNRSERWVGRLMGFQEVVSERGYEPGARILEMGMINTHSDHIREALHERAVWQLRRIRFADDNPVAIEHAFYPPDIGLELEKRDLLSISIYRVFEEELGFEIGSATQTISSRLSTPDEQSALKLAGLSALTDMTRLTIAADGRPLEYLQSLYQPEFFQFSINLQRGPY